MNPNNISHLLYLLSFKLKMHESTEKLCIEHNLINDHLGMVKWNTSVTVLTALVPQA